MNERARRWKDKKFTKSGKVIPLKLREDLWPVLANQRLAEFDRHAKGNDDHHGGNGEGATS